MFIELCDPVKELKRRGVDVDLKTSTAAQIARKKLLSTIVTMEKDYLDQFLAVKDMIADFKSQKRRERDEKKRKKTELMDAIQHEAARFEAVRGAEKRLGE